MSAEKDENGNVHDYYTYYHFVKKKRKKYIARRIEHSLRYYDKLKHLSLTSNERERFQLEIDTPL
jgi:hypothetical protein